MGLEGPGKKIEKKSRIASMARNALFGAVAFTAASASEAGKDSAQTHQHATHVRKADHINPPRFKNFRRSENVEDRQQEEGSTHIRPFDFEELIRTLQTKAEVAALHKSDLAKKLGSRDIAALPPSTAMGLSSAHRAELDALIRKTKSASALAPKKRK